MRRNANSLTSKLLDISPYLIVFITFFISYLPSLFIHIQGTTTMLVLIPLFYFATQSPDKIGYLTVTIVGMLADSLEGKIIGVNTFMLLFFQTGCSYISIYLLDKSFSIIWLSFAVAAIVAFAMKWGLFALVLDVFVPLGAFSLSILKIILLYPVIHFGLYKLYAKQKLKRR